MSVYTSLCHAQIEQFICAYPLGVLISYTGISAGIENTNYRLKTVQGDFILTLYEHFEPSELVPYLELLIQLGALNEYYPSPIPTIKKSYFNLLLGKPAAIFPCLPGLSVVQVSSYQCQLVAAALAKFHLENIHFSFKQENPRGMQWIEATAARISTQLSQQDTILLYKELKYQRQQITGELTQGLIHADLFKDNVLFVNDRLTGMLDFYLACHDSYLLDIAISMSDWCVDEKGGYQQKNQALFLSSYQKIREIPQKELRWLPLLLRRVCLRFWLAHLVHYLYPIEGEITQEKSPQHFKSLLRQHQQFDIADKGFSAMSSMV